MAGERTLPGLGLTGFWAVGSNGWQDQNDGNLRTLSALVQAAVDSATTALPASPANGAMFIVPANDATNPHKIAVRDNGAWVYLTAREGMLVYVKDTDVFVVFDGAVWGPLSAGGGGSAAVTVVTKTASYVLALADASSYVRMSAIAPHTLTVPTNAVVAFPVGTTISIRQASIGQTEVVGSAGVTINTSETLKLRKQHSAATLIKVGTNEWDLTGDVELL